MAVVKSPKNNKRKNLWIKKKVSKLKIVTTFSVSQLLHNKKHSKKKVKPYKLLQFKNDWKNSIGRIMLVTLKKEINR